MLIILHPSAFHTHSCPFLFQVDLLKKNMALRDRVLLRAECKARSKVLSLISDKPEYERPAGRPASDVFEKLIGISKTIHPISTRFSLSGKPMDYLHVAKFIIFSFKLVFLQTLNIILQ